jgi:demethylspheroidene O-methyltransferase
MFRRWAARLPLTRGIARRRARRLFDLVSGFVYSQVLRACVELRLFERLAERTLTAAEVAADCRLPADRAERLLAAAVALDLVSRGRDGRYRLGPLGAVMVGNRALAAMIEHHDAFYADLADPVGLLRRAAGDTRMAAYWPYAGAADPAKLTRGNVDAYTDLMSASQPLVSEIVLDAYSLRRHRSLLDVGGGDGTFSCAVAERARHLRLTLFDLPPVAERAAARFASAGLSGRARAVGGDFLADPLPGGADVVTLVRVVHDHDDARVLHLFRSIARALEPGGTLLIAEPMAGVAGSEAVGDAYFGFYLLAMGRGGARTPDAIGRLLLAAGFSNWRLVPTAMPLQASLIVARVGATRVSESVHNS